MVFYYHVLIWWQNIKMRSESFDVMAESQNDVRIMSNEVRIIFWFWHHVHPTEKWPTPRQWLRVNPNFRPLFYFFLCVLPWRSEFSRSMKRRRFRLIPTSTETSTATSTGPTTTTTAATSTTTRTTASANSIHSLYPVTMLVLLIGYLAVL